MNMYQPYTYFLYHKPTGLKYYGSKTANNKNDIADPKTFWINYFTSSKEIAKLIVKYGKGSFSFKIHKLFKTKDDALYYEAYVLKYYNVLDRRDWINQNIGGTKFTGLSGSKRVLKKPRKKIVYTAERIENMRKALTGRKLSQEHREKLKEKRQGRTPFAGKTHSISSRKQISESMKKTLLAKKNK